MPLIKDLIHIPEKVQRGDFVLNLSTGLAQESVHQTLAQYVVTPQLAKAFDSALAFLKSTVDSTQNRQKGAYLHGSFGSGKSHFMAVLNLLLKGVPEARAIPELAAAIAKHDDWMQRKNILLVPYHMIGAASIEAGILGGYATHIARLHPQAPVPGFYASDRLLKDAQNIRQQIGDAAFFQSLNKHTSGADDGWGDIASGWDAFSFDAVMNGAAPREDRIRLVSDLIASFFQSTRDLAKTDDGSFVDFDEGLRIMTEHAKALGYDAIVLFLDELILWLASHLSDQRFITHNIQKVVKLVEPSEPRALPLASFIARQRDLREFVGDQYAGRDQEILSDSLKYWEGRFDTIVLEDRNLPVIAERRLLAPVDEAAKQQVNAAFDALNRDPRMKEEIQNILLTNQGDRQMFRSLYPFSPALVQALVALSSALQRERTALKVMLMLLVEQRDTLELGGLIPVGDLYDVIASEAEPFSETMRKHFDVARQLFERKLVPLLEAEYNLRYSELDQVPDTDQNKRAFITDIRLLKTLLLAALVPEVECFKQLTGNKLAALNHGTIKSPIPGREGQAVYTKCRKWAAQVGEIKLQEDEQNPVISIQLAGVDTESILEQAQIQDNEGARKKLIKDMLFDAFGMVDTGEVFQEQEHTLLWRGTRRTVEVLFHNIREITDARVFEARGDNWKVLVDFPFDKEGHTPVSDRARIEGYQTGGGSAQTLCWLPYFLSQKSQQDLGLLVRLEHILKNDDRFATYSRHLSPIDRAQARSLLENQRSQLRQRIKDFLLCAYGVTETVPGALDDSVTLEQQVISLEPGFTPRLPVGSTLGKAFEQLVGQALAYQFPDHPDFDAEVKIPDLNKVLEQLRRAILAENGRIEVESPLRPFMRSIAQPLGLGEMHERHFIFKPTWPQQLTRELAKDSETDEPITVRRLRAAMDKPKPKGLPESVQNLLILVFQEHGQYAFSLHGGQFDANLKDLPDNLVLIKQDLAETAVWEQGVNKAAAVLGVAVSPLRTANNQNEMQKKVREVIKEYLPHCENLVKELAIRLPKLALNTQCNRMKNAHYAVELLRNLSTLEGAQLVRAVAEIKPVTSEAALAKSIKSSGSVTQTLQENNWVLLEGVWSRNPAGVAIKQRISDGLAADELVLAISPVLRQAQLDATKLVTDVPAVPPVNPSPVIPAVGRRIVKQASKNGLDIHQAKSLLADIQRDMAPGDKLDIAYSITRNEHEGD